MKILKKDTNGALGGKALIVFVVVLGLALAYMSGMINISLPSTGLADKYSETVNRNLSDVGMIVPLTVKLTFVQDASTGDNKADIDVFVKHKHEALGSDDNYVPDASLVNTVTFNTDVGNVGDISSIYSINGMSIKASNVTYNTTLTTLNSVNIGNAQKNYKVWTSSSTYTPVLSKDSSALLIQTVWKHYRKATGQLLGADTVSWIINYEMPTYNADDSYTQSYTYNVFVPFNDYSGDPTNSALVEDITFDILSYFEHCTIEWRTITAVTHEYWDFPALNQFFPDVAGQIKLVRAKDTVLTTALQYSWLGPTNFALDNAKEYGSHTYQYKIR